VSDLPIFIRK